MIYELRVYRIMPGRMTDTLERFEKLIFRYWDKHGIRPLGFWTTAIGECHLDLHQLLQWDSLAERERIWTAFTSDPGFKTEFAETERSGVMVESVKNTILTPTRFSKLQ